MRSYINDFKGGIVGQESAYQLDHNTIFQKGKTIPVSGNLAAILGICDTQVIMQIFQLPFKY